MGFDIDLTATDMLSAIKKVTKDNWGEIKTTSADFVQHRKSRLELLSQLRIAGEITNEQFLSRLEDEKQIFQAELNAMAVISKAIAQNAANAAIEVLEKSVGAALKAL
jgi:hypothetical protein